MYVHNLSPFIIDMGNGSGIRWYGMSYLLGFIAAYLVTLQIAKRRSGVISAALAGDFIFSIALGTVIGGRLGYCLFYDQKLFVRFSRDFPFWGVLELHHGGMASHGGMIGIIAAVFWFSRKHRLEMLPLLDLLALSGPIGIFFGRIANFINGELVGRPCDPALLWAVKFPQDILTWPITSPERLKTLSALSELLGIDKATWIQLVSRDPSNPSVQSVLYQIVVRIQNGSENLRMAIAPLLTPRHPSQLYEALLEGLLLFLIVLLVYLKKRIKGAASAAFLISYALVRIMGEQFRMPDLQIGYQLFGLTRGQWLSSIMLLLGFGFLVWCLRRERQYQ